MGVIVVPMRVAAGLRHPVASKWRKFYGWIGRRLLQSEADGTIHTPDSVPVFSVEQLDAEPGLPARSLRENLLQHDSGSHVVVVHLDAVQDTVAPTNAEAQLYNEIRLACLAVAHYSDSPAFTFVVFRSHLPHERDALRSILKSEVAAGQVHFVSEAGAYLGAAPRPPEASELQLRFRELSDEARDQVRLKLIRARGHFQRRVGGAEVCTRFWFDASECVAEVVACLRTDHSALFSRSRRIVYDAEVSDWLHDVVSILSQETGLPVVSFRSKQEFGAMNPSRDDLILLPVVDSGETLRAILSCYEQDRGGLPVAVIAVVATGSELVEERQIRRGFPIDVHVVVGVERALDASSDCSLCHEAKQEPMASLDSRELELSTVSFWEIVADPENGFRTFEEHVPNGRNGLLQVPNFTSILTGQDGLWIARMLLRRVRHLAGDRLSSSLPLLAPDQSGARALVQRLRQLAPSTQGVFVPTQIINRFRGEVEPSLSRDEQNQPWARRLRSLSGDTQPIVCEEFTVSGGSAKALRKLAGHFGKQPTIFLSNVDFPDSQARSAELASGSQISLYTIDVWRAADKLVDAATSK